MITDRSWAITPAALAEMRALNVSGEDAPEDRPVEPERDGATAIIAVCGPLEMRTSLMGMMMGGTSYGSLIAALAAADADPDVARIVLAIDSPGGTVAGAHEAHAALAQVGKPTEARIVGTCASAAYWLASAADCIVAAKTAVVGQIGTQMVSFARGDEVVLTSRCAPEKNADPSEHPEQYQAILDEQAHIFRSDVARGRGLDGPESVETQFGRGAILSASAALKAGMIDAITEDQMSEDTGRAEAAPEEEDVADMKATIASLQAELAALKAAEGEPAPEDEEKPKPPMDEEEEDEPEAKAVAMLRAQHGSVAAAVVHFDASLKAIQREKYEGARSAAIDAAVQSGQITADPTTRSLATLAYDAEQAGGEKLWTAMVAGAPAVPMGRVSHGDTAARTPADPRMALHEKTVAYIVAHPDTHYGAASLICARGEK